MKTVPFSLNAANPVWQYANQVKYIRYEEGAAPGGVTPLIDVQSISGYSLDLEMKPGAWTRLPALCDGVRVVNISGAASITGKLTLGSGDAGNDAQFGTFALDAPTIAALIAGKYNVRPEAHTNSYLTNAAIGANTAETVLLPANNPNGAIVQYASIGDREVNVNNMGFLAKASAPANAFDGVPILMATPQPNDSGANNFAGMLQKDVFVPSGLGIYFISTLAIALNGFHHRAMRILVL